MTFKTRIRIVIRGAVFALLCGSGALAGGSTIYSSIGNLAENPYQVGACSTCGGVDYLGRPIPVQALGEELRFASNVTLGGVAVAVTASYWPQTITIDFFKHPYYSSGYVYLGSLQDREALSTPKSVIATSYGTDVVSFALPHVSLPADNYDVFVESPNLAIPLFFDGGVGYSVDNVYGRFPQAGDAYQFLNGRTPSIYNYNIGIDLIGTPEPHDWLLLLAGISLVGVELRGRRNKSHMTLSGGKDSRFCVAL